MRHLRITATIDQERAPAFYTALADSPTIDETRLLEWNTTLDSMETVLFAIDGDPEPFVRAAPEMTAVESVRLSGEDRRWTTVLVEMRAQETPMFATIREARTQPGLVVRKPIVYRDGDMHFRVVGDAEALQSAIDDAPEGIGVQIKQIETLVDGPAGPAAGLSERQREAITVALDAGYYDHPRTATQADIADELGCAPQTAAEHLQKAEATLIRETMRAGNHDA